ncbi:N-formylglutamate amidohydrolase [Sabulibacter ruber]|uniref:N-formylglutamate amidohydrolase n=1 Tax=Sabulibacter ruber TaxID=2811901 RepID=UPI001A95777E|nr:N-formylglutamate amidohydrolase [Sabulibacter ruber]
MAIFCLLSCEHAGNVIPEEYLHLFKGKEEVLFSHKAIDFGALRLARHLAKELEVPLSIMTTSRLLVEGNRSLGTDELFSEYTRHLPDQEKQAILEEYYFAHRQKVEQRIQDRIKAGYQVLHLAVHSFTPALEGEVREVEIGILFDPDRALEETFARELKNSLHDLNPERKVMYNEPYPGVADGFPTYLRGKFGPDQYAGFELEVNQKFFLDGEERVWQQVVWEITEALKSVLKAGD